MSLSNTKNGFVLLGFSLSETSQPALKFVLVSTDIDLEFIPYQALRLLKNWTLRLPWVFQFIGSEVNNFIDKTFPLPLLLKEGYVWFHGRSLLHHGVSGS